MQGYVDMLAAILRWRAQALARRHRRELASVCEVGAEFNAAPWQALSAILNFRVKNVSGLPDRVVIGDYCNLDARVYCNARGRITIGNHVYMNSTAVLRCDHRIAVGSNCLFGPNVRLWDTNNHPMSVSARERQARETALKTIDSYESDGGPIVVADSVWLCMDTIVLANVTIGYGSIVAAGSIVTSDIPAMTLAAGIPARPIGPVPA